MKTQLANGSSAEIPIHCSSKGIAISYMTTETDDGMRALHHISISKNTGRFHARNAAFLCAYLIHCLQVENWLKQINTQNRKVMHLAFTVNKEDQARFMDLPVLSDPIDTATFRDKTSDIKFKKL